MINSTKFSRMLYYCNLNNDCSSQYEVNKYDEYYDVSFNNLERLENCQTELNKEERIRNMIKAKAKLVNIAKTLKLDQDKKKLKSLYNIQKKVKDEEDKTEEALIYDQGGLEKWAKERTYSPEQLSNLASDSVFVAAYDLGVDFYYVMLTCMALVTFATPLIDNWNYLGL